MPVLAALVDRPNAAHLQCPPHRVHVAHGRSVQQRIDDSRVRKAAAQALAKIGAAAAPASDALCRELASAPETDIRYFAAQALGNDREGAFGGNRSQYQI